MANNPRRTNSTRRNKLRDRVKALGYPCAICGKPIDYSLPAKHPMSYELDEIVPVSCGGSPYDIDNVQATHRICNQKKGNKNVLSTGANKKDNLIKLPQSKIW